MKFTIIIIIMDQDAIMDGITTKIKNAGIGMRKSLESADLKGALKFSKNMLTELRTSSITPRNYYNLCIHFIKICRSSMK